MERGSDRLGPARDEEMKHQLQGMLRSNHSTHVEEWNDPEPPADDDPELFQAVADVRVELARLFRRADFPADREQLVRALRERHAPDRWVELLETLPGGTRFDRLQSVVDHLGEGR
ncbi:DUF2795 domain-containing protein [Streptomyces capparidis]